MKLISKIEKELNNKIIKTKKYIDNTEKIEILLDKATEIIENLPVDENLKYIPIFISLLNNYIKGKYKNVSIQTLIASIALILYFISPLDIIPDFKSIGFLDDAYVACICMDIVGDELNNYIIWKEKHKSLI